MAATRLIALHKNKGKSVAACLKSRTDYVQNPDKTEQGELVSCYECSPLTVDEEFMLSKRQYELSTGRSQKSDIIAYQIRQSFKPGEITAEEANKVGCELAMRFTKGNHAFVVATHTDRQHIHNHVIFNSTALDGTRKFRDFFFSALAVQRLSDLICLEHQLSVIEIKPYRERQKRTLYPPKESNRDCLCGVIDNILAEKPKDYEDFLQKLEQQGYEVKRGKYTSVKGARQKRFIRFRTLGAGYSEEELKVVISGEVEHHPRQKQNRIVPEQKFQMLVDIQAKLTEGKSIDQSFLAESSGLFLLKTFVHHTSYGCMVWFTNAKQANIRRETYTSQLMKGGHFTMNLPLFISSANFLLMKSLLLVLFRGLCSLLGLTAQQKIN